MQKNLDNWSIGDPLKASHFQQPVDSLNKLLPVIGGDGIAVTAGPSGTLIQNTQTSVSQEVFLGQIQVHGPNCGGGDLPDFPDQRYWVKSVVPTQQTCETLLSVSQIQNGPILTVGDEGMLGGYYMVQNVHEFLAGTHLLLPGDFVAVFTVETRDASDQSGDGRTVWKRYWIVEVPKARYAEIVCKGPVCDGSAADDFTDNRYWGKLQVVANQDDSLSSPLLFEDWDDPSALPTCEGGDDTCCDGCGQDHSSCSYQESNTRSIICLENLAERNCRTHNVLPGTIVKLDWTIDSNGFPRYTTSYADTTMCGLSPCPPPSSSSGSSSSGACCDTIEVQWTGDTSQPKIQMTQAGGNTWTSSDDQSFISQAVDGSWSMTLTTPDGDSSLYTAAAAPCPPTDAGSWTFVSIVHGAGAALISMDCGSSSSSSSGSSSSGSSGSSGSGSGSGSCTPICNIRWNLSTKCLEYSTDGTTWSTVENSCASPCSTTPP